jgi:hypothetical protein
VANLAFGKGVKPSSPCAVKPRSIPSHRGNLAFDSRLLLRARTIKSSQQAIKIKIVYLCLVGGERSGEERRVDFHARTSFSTCF